MELNNPNYIYPKNYQIMNTINSGSSTNIRERIKNKTEGKLSLGICGLTTKRVINYIEENGLYN